MGAEPRVTGAMDTYVRIRLLAAPSALLNYAVLGYRARPRRGPARAGCCSSCSTAPTSLLCIVLGLKLGWGVPGVAWATVCGETVAACRRPGDHPGRRSAACRRLSRQRIFDRRAMLAMLTLNRDIMIRSFALLAAFALFTRQGAQFGTLTLAANAVLMNFFLVAGYFLDGFATAAEQLAGRAIGARYRPALHRGGAADRRSGALRWPGCDQPACCWPSAAIWSA